MPGKDGYRGGRGGRGEPGSDFGRQNNRGRGRGRGRGKGRGLGFIGLADLDELSFPRTFFGFLHLHENMAMSATIKANNRSSVLQIRTKETRLIILAGEAVDGIHLRISRAQLRDTHRRQGVAQLPLDEAGAITGQASTTL